jgi:nicotinamidase-related amidase
VASTLILTGVTTEVCVSSTLRTAVDRGYRCITVRDACASSYADLHAASLLSAWRAASSVR